MTNFRTRQPNRATYYEKAWMFLGIGILSAVILIGWFLTPIFFILALIHIFRAWRYPVIEVHCPQCRKKQKIEPMVTRYFCVRCSRIIKKAEDTEDAWVVS